MRVSSRTSHFFGPSSGTVDDCALELGLEFALLDELELRELSLVLVELSEDSELSTEELVEVPDESLLEVASEDSTLELAELFCGSSGLLLELLLGDAGSEPADELLGVGLVDGVTVGGGVFGAEGEEELELCALLLEVEEFA